MELWPRSASPAMWGAEKGRGEKSPSDGGIKSGKGKVLPSSRGGGTEKKEGAYSNPSHNWEKGRSGENVWTDRRNPEPSCVVEGIHPKPGGDGTGGMGRRGSRKGCSALRAEQRD